MVEFLQARPPTFSISQNPAKAQALAAFPPVVALKYVLKKHKMRPYPLHYNPLFEFQKRVSRVFFLALCKVSIQERVMMAGVQYLIRNNSNPVHCKYIQRKDSGSAVKPL